MPKKKPNPRSRETLTRETPPPITTVEFAPGDHRRAHRIAEQLGYRQYAYTSTSSLWGLFCIADNPAEVLGTRRANLPPYRHGCIIKTAEFGLMFVQIEEDLAR